MKDPVPGEFTIAALQMTARNPGWFVTYDVDGVVAAPGVSPTPIHRGDVMVRWAEPLAVGQVYPALVDRADPRRCVIEFPPTAARRGASRAEREQAAEDLARRMSEGGGAPGA